MKTNGEIVCEDKIDVSIAKPFLEFLFSQGCKWGYVQTSFPCRVFKDEDFEDYEEEELVVDPLATPTPAENETVTTENVVENTAVEDVTNTVAEDTTNTVASKEVE